MKLNVINTENKNRKTCRFDYVLSQWKLKKGIHTQLPSVNKKVLSLFLKCTLW